MPRGSAGPDYGFGIDTIRLAVRLGAGGAVLGRRRIKEIASERTGRTSIPDRLAAAAAVPTLAQHPADAGLADLTDSSQ